MKPKINSADLQNFCCGVAAKWNIRKRIILHPYNNAYMLINRNDKAKTCLSCSLYIRTENEVFGKGKNYQYSCRDNTDTLTESNKLWHVRSIFYKLTLYSSSRPLCHQFQMLLFTLLARNVTITVSQ